MIFYDLETFNNDKAVPYANCTNRLGKIWGKYNRDITQTENEKCRKDCIVFKGTDSNIKMLDHVLQFKGKAKKISNRMLKKLICTY